MKSKKKKKLKIQNNFKIEALKKSQINNKKRKIKKLIQIIKVI